MLALASLDPVLTHARRHRGPAGHPRVGLRRGRSREGHRCWRASSWSTALPRWRWRVGRRSCCSATWPCAPGTRRWPWSTRCSPGGRWSSPSSRCAPGATCTASGTPRDGPARSPRPRTASVVERRVPDRRPRLHRRPAVVRRGVPPRGGRARARAERGPVAGRPVPGPPRTRASALEVSAWARRLSTPRRRRPSQVVEADRAPGPRPRGARDDRSRPPCGRPPTRSSCAPRPAVDVVAGYPWFGAWSRDTMIAYEGLFLATGRADEGRELLRGYAGDAVGGHARQHGRHRAASSTTPPTPRCGSCTRSTGTWPRPATTTSPPSWSSRWTRCVQAPPRRHPVRHPDRPGRRAAHPGRARARADLDGRGRRRYRRHPAPGQGGRAQRAVDQRDRRAGRPAPAGPAATPTTWTRCWPGRPRRSSAGSRAPAGWLYDVVDAPGAATTTALRPNQLLAYGLPYAPLRGHDDGAVRAVARTLLTPLGLRTLAPPDPRLPGRAPGRPGRPRPGLPPGHRLAVADRAVRRRRPGRRAADRRAAGRAGRAPGRVGRRIGQRDRRRGRPARRHRLPVPGVVGRRVPAHLAHLTRLTPARPPPLRVDQDVCPATRRARIGQTS